MKKLTMFFVLSILFCVPLLSACATKSEKLINKVSKNISEYTIDMTLSDNHTLEASQTINYINNNNSLHSDIYMHLYPNNFAPNATNKPVSSLHYDRAYPNGFSGGKIDISSVKINDSDAKYEFDGKDNDFLRLILSDGLAPDDKCKISLTYTVTIPNCLHRFGYGDNTINIANFYPILCVYENGEWLKEPYHSNGDPFYSDIANYHVNFTYPSKYIVAHTGVMESSNLSGDQKCDTYSARAVRDFALVASEKFSVIEAMAGDTKVEYYYYDDAHAEDSLKCAVDSINTFSKNFGTYPYSTYSVVKSNFIHGGMEFPNLVYISDSVSEKADYLNVIVHETGHQWWYGLVGSDAYRFGWLDEGLTDYSCAIFYKDNPEYGVEYSKLMDATLENYHTFVDIYTRVLGHLDTSMNRDIANYNSEAEYVYLTYVKGSLLFDNISQVVGYNKLIKTLATYFDTYKFTNVTPDHFIATLEKVTKREMRGFVNSWLEGKVKL